MIHELPTTRFHHVRDIFRDRKQYVPVFAVLDGRFPGKVHVDNIGLPATAMVLALTRWAYVDGDVQNGSFLSDLPCFIQDVIAPISRQLNMNWFELYAPPEERWIAALDSTLVPLNAEKHWESTYVLDIHAYQRQRRDAVIPHGMELRLRHLPLIPASAMEPQPVPVKLVEQTAVGYELLRGDRVISVCRSNGLQAGNEFMVDVRTYRREDRRKGYARLVATALIDHALEGDLLPLWETTEDNTASRRLAESLGYVEAESYPVYAMPLDTIG